jgi:hypothetical protein
MSSSIPTSSNYCAPVRFHQIREGESMQDVASKYQVDFETISQQNPAAAKAGDMVVIRFSESRIG